MGRKQSKPVSQLFSVMVMAAWFGIVTGLVEGCGLLLFQRINWARWGPMMHVSAEIVWISPIVDFLFFVLVTLVAMGPAIGIARLAPQIPARRVVAAALTFLAIYDWLTLTGRLDHRACLLLAAGAAVAFVRWLAKHEDSALRFWRRTVPWVLALFLLAWAGIEGGGRMRERNAAAKLLAAEADSPNVVVMVVDTLRADHVSAYGYGRTTTPHLDEIAKAGVLFENAVSTCSWSLPSHVSLLTGRYEFEHGVGNVQPEPWQGWGGAGLGGYPTLGEALEKRGYRTGAFSANRTYFSHDLGFGRGFMHFEDYFHSAADMFVRTLYGREFSRIYLIRSDRSLVKRTLRGMGFTSLLDQDAEGSGSYGGAFGIRKHADTVDEEMLRWVDRDRRRPFFAFLNYFDVHGPYGGPRSYPKPAWGQTTDVDRYDDGVKYVDDAIGQLMRELERRGRAGNTLVIITSDHGEALGEHSLMAHGRALYWDLIHVPLIVWFPGHVPAGMKVSGPVSNVATAATVLDLLGEHGDTEFPGPPLDWTWQKPEMAGSWPDPLSELAENKYAGKGDQEALPLIPNASTGGMKSVITPQWHFIAHERAGEQLYDWKHDPGELNNLANSAAGKAEVESIKAQLARRTKKAGQAQ